MSILSKKKTSTLWILLVQGGSYSYKVELTFTIDLYSGSAKFRRLFHVFLKEAPTLVHQKAPDQEEEDQYAHRRL